MENSLSIVKEEPVDLLVVGGGLAGTFAAIAAKRTNPNMNIWLIEQYGFLGGMATAGYVFPFMNYATSPTVAQRKNGSKYKRLIGGIFQELVEILHEKGYCESRAYHDFYKRFDPMMIRCVLDQMVMNENVNLLFHTIVNFVKTSASDNQQKISEVWSQTKAGVVIFRPKWVVDATGDADIVYHAKAPYEMGRDSDGLTQPATLNFRVGEIGTITAGRKQIAKKVIAAKQNGKSLTPRNDCLMFQCINPHEKHFNQTRVSGFDFTNPFELTQAELEGRKQAENFFKFLRDDVRGYKHAQMIGMGAQIGIRETRRIVGEYVLTEDDIIKCTKFDDRIVLGNYPIDIHDPKGSASTDLRHIPKNEWYSIPYRSLVPKTLSNCIVAGRPISSTHVAHSAIRVMPICSGIGHAAGVAIGLCAKENLHDVREVNVSALQNELKNQNAVLD